MANDKSNNAATAKSNVASLITGDVAMASEEQTMEVRRKDVVTAVVIIDTCSKRGAFEGPELEFIGQLRSRLVQTLSPAEQEGQAELLTE